MGDKKKSHDHAPETPGKLGKKDYEDALKDLHVELVKLQQWVVAKGLKVIVIFEGRDGAGKGGSALVQTVQKRLPGRREVRHHEEKRRVPSRSEERLPSAGQKRQRDRGRRDDHGHNGRSRKRQANCCLPT